MNRIDKEKWWAIGYLMAYLIVYVIFVKVVMKALRPPMAVSVTVQIGLYVILGLLGFRLFQGELAEGLRAWRESTWKSFLWLVGGYVANIALMTVFSMPLALLYPEYESLNENNVAYLIGKYPGALLLISLGILGPMTEEAIFRLLPWRLCKGRLQAVWFILPPAICFMLIHVHAFTAMELLYHLPYLATGLVYGVLLHGSRNATLPILLHVCNNFFAILGMLMA